MINVCYSYGSVIKYNFDGTGVLWLVYMLIAIRLLFKLNKRIAKDNNMLLTVIVLFESYIGYLLGNNGYYLPWSFDVALVCMIFYYVGYLFKEYNVLDNIYKSKLLILLLVCIWVIGINNSWFELAMRNYSSGLYGFIIAIAGSLVVIGISKIIDNKTKYISEFFAFCGRNSLYILFGHHIEWVLFKYGGILDIKSSSNKALTRRLLIICKCSFSVFFAFIISKTKALIKQN